MLRSRAIWKRMRGDNICEQGRTRGNFTFLKGDRDLGLSGGKAGLAGI
jgi:hypothetical protein